MGALAWTRGKKSYRNGEESAKIFQELAVFISNSLGGMICGVTLSAAGGGELGRGPFSEPGRSTAGGPLSIFLILFPFLFLFLFENLCK
jgi:hypothetical protein